MIEITRDEAEKVIVFAVARDGVHFSELPSIMQLQAIAACINIVSALQELGWILSKPESTSDTLERTH